MKTKLNTNTDTTLSTLASVLLAGASATAIGMVTVLSFQTLSLLPV